MSEKNDRLPYLFERYFNKTVTPAEREELETLLSSDLGNTEELYPLLENAWMDYKGGEPVVSDEKREKILKEILGVDRSVVEEPTVRSIPFLRRWYWAAASVIILLGAGFYFWETQKQINKGHSIASVPVVPDVQPGKEGAILTLADGTELVLDSLGNGIVTNQIGVNVVLANGKLMYQTVGAAETSSSNVYNTLVTPRGRQFNLVLPDGSRVWLNAASSIRYPTTFTGNLREVEITGEAYFEVAQAKTAPFIVKTKDSEIEVLGTSFNVNSYGDESSIKTTLLNDQNLFTRQLNGSVKYRFAGFVLEIWKAENPEKKTISVSPDYGVLNNQLHLHRGKHADHQVFMEYDFDTEGMAPAEIENQARNIADRIGKHLHDLDKSLVNAEITQFAWECSYRVAPDSASAKALVKGHHILDFETELSSCSDVVQLKVMAEQLVDGLQFETRAGDLRHLHIAGALIPVEKLELSPNRDPGLQVPLTECRFDFGNFVPNRFSSQVIVAGGGTAGAMVAIGSSEKGANTIVAEYFNDLGGTKTMCGVMAYYHGYREHPYFMKQDSDANNLATALNMNKKLGRMEYLRRKISGQGGRIFGGSILCGASVSNHSVTGILICRNSRLELINAPISVDATGDGDIAWFAGASFQHGDQRSGKTQNYSQWDITGAGPMPSAATRDYDIIDNTQISELQRGLFLSHYEAHYYDFHPMLAVRESRRIEGLYELNVLDAVEGTHFPDVLSYASSDFDPHTVGASELIRCGFLLPHSNELVLEIPYRCIVPRTIDGLLISGKAFSQTHHAIQFTRMSADLTVLGYLTGQIAADIAWKGIQPRHYDVSTLQREWLALGYFPSDLLRRKAGNLLNDDGETKRRINELASGKPEYLYECIRLPGPKVLPLLEDVFAKTTSSSARLLVAKCMAWFGGRGGTQLILDELE